MRLPCLQMDAAWAGLQEAVAFTDTGGEGWGGGSFSSSSFVSSCLLWVWSRPYLQSQQNKPHSFEDFILSAEAPLWWHARPQCDECSLLFSFSGKEKKSPLLYCWIHFHSDERHASDVFVVGMVREGKDMRASVWVGQGEARRAWGWKCVCKSVCVCVCWGGSLSLLASCFLFPSPMQDGVSVHRSLCLCFFLKLLNSGKRRTKRWLWNIHERGQSHTYNFKSLFEG